MCGIWVEIHPHWAGLEGDLMSGRCEFRDIVDKRWQQ